MDISMVAGLTFFMSQLGHCGPISYIFLSVGDSMGFWAYLQQQPNPAQVTEFT
jgi:hypothetical protein